MQVIVNTRQKILSAMKVVTRLSMDAAIRGMDMEAERPLVFWLSGELPPAIAAEMDNSCFDDCVSFRVAEVGGDLETLHTNFLEDLAAHAAKKGYDADGEDPFHDFSAAGKRPWAAQLGDESSLEEIHAVAKETIFVQLPGAKMVEFCVNVVEAGAQFQGFRFRKFGPQDRPLDTIDYGI